MDRHEGTEASAARRAGLAARRALPAPERTRRSALVADRLSELPELLRSARVAAYLATGAEVDLGVLWDRLATDGVQLHLPRLRGHGPTGATGDAPDRTMDFVRWSPGDPLEANRYGIGEPDGESVAVSTFDAVVLPCVAVDNRGTRVGFGAGFYDRALADVHREQGSHRPNLIGVAFDDQRCDAIAAQPWDVPLDLVVTDALVLRTDARL